jgi:uncharacterized damage-inducible protein DinB
MVGVSAREEHEMPGMVAPVSNELEGLLAYAAQQRQSIRNSLHGLTFEQATSTPTVSALSLAGLAKHVALCERNWIVNILAQRNAEMDYMDSFSLREDETIDDVIALLDEVGAETEEIVRALPSLDHPAPVPQGVPWFPSDVEAWSARWVLLHVIEEIARHAGHADIIREAIDGKTMYELMAEAEGWKSELDEMYAKAEEMSNG